MSSSSLTTKGPMSSLTSAFQKLKDGAKSVAAPAKDRAEEILQRVTGIYEVVHSDKHEYEELTNQLIFLTTRVFNNLPPDDKLSEEMREALDAVQTGVKS
ncbi:hypothetical protein CALCODRAFT_330788 [Calocera cornea HHB12733]|uniref:Uncharacterized protein n=1 Tax=Calocera cornea HHB12733 TaxID=1353952 RepID=A0A165F299_9BASI|nr:hypothetical protein CALCODRAFT_330788 [Calocera cornea HHB12733]